MSQAAGGAATIAAVRDASTDAPDVALQVEGRDRDADLVFAAPADAGGADAPPLPDAVAAVVPPDAPAVLRDARRIPRTPAELRRPVRSGVGAGRRHNPWE